MSEYVNINDLIHRGGLYYNIKGSDFKTVYKNLSELVALPPDLSSEEFFAELCAREEVMSTAVGKGISIPHPRRPLLKNYEDQRIIVAFLEEPLHISTPDLKPVSVLFVLLSSNKTTHLSILSNLAFLFQKDVFINLLKTKPEEHVLLTEIKKYLV